MAFKPRKTHSAVLADPVQFFRSLPHRKIETENPHQREVLLEYAARHHGSADLAIQLPTGSGKTLVGLMIAEWRRLKNSERVVYLCPTKQLVHQTVRQANEVYGLDVKGFVDSNKTYDAGDVAQYRSGNAVAVTTYSSVFNSNPFFDDAHVLILDDAHTVENYVAKNWSLEISKESKETRDLFNLMCSVLSPHMSRFDIAMLRNDVKPEVSRGWCQLLTVDKLLSSEVEITDLLDRHSKSANLHYSWSLLRGHLECCNIFMAPGEILIRPYIPPSWSNKAFSDPKTRIYLSATLGAGGDLERLTGRRRINRMPAPEGLEGHGVGRRFFIFPTRSLEGDEAGKLISSLVKMTPRAVCLTASDRRAEEWKGFIKGSTGYKIFSSRDIEASKAGFVSHSSAVAVLAGRFDGIDFPKDESRLLLIDDLPSMINLQERFISNELSSDVLFRDRKKTRMLQAIGRCTRSFVDTSAVVICGVSLRDYFLDVDLRKELHPELQAEIDFGDYQSSDVEPDELVENFKSFLSLDSDWQAASNEILNEASTLSQELPSYLPELQDCVKDEVRFSECMWRSDYVSAYEHALDILGKLQHSQLKGLRAFWSYKAGVAALLEGRETPRYQQMAIDQFSAASKASDISWMRSLRGALSGEKEAPENSKNEQFQAKRIANKFASMGVANNSRFNREIELVLEGLSDLTKFEGAQVKLGELLGFISENSNESAAPDPWWATISTGVVFEDYAEAKSSSALSPTKAKQALGHINWLKENRSELAEVNFQTIIVTPATKIHKGALPQIKNSLIWSLSDYGTWCQQAVDVLRGLKASFKSEDDLVWQAECIESLRKNNLSMETLLPYVEARDMSERLKVVEGQSLVE
ncbi:DEAD/DEAH box helicase [Leisingera sp. ANG-M6]|uniref:DEAD/DEAH box helicase n=1 Tax=Leisingera sp. ANG-M6 TaxID=1577900 RepID=UPI0005808DEB|nr:DEAD/DEAH box helicase [Leisingera sp. ANG-M6]KIC27817.1 hypothetical protein RA24_14095 [Leisingera sp. ANG-M6]